MRIKKILQYLFYPIIILITLGTSFVLINKFSEQYIVLLPLIILSPLLVVFITLEKIAPYHQKWNSNLNDFTTDLIQTFITLPFAIQLSQLLLPILLYIPHKWLTETAHINYLGSNDNLIGPFILALLLSEFCYYWMHRLSHTLPTLWKFHSVHHSAKRIYWANSGRFHFVDALLGGIAYLLPLLLFNTSDKLIILVLILSGITGFLEHVNIKFKAGFLNYIFNTAELHRWHHSEIEKESNNNYGKALIIWDIIFGTFLWPTKKEINNVGIRNVKDPKGFKNQLLYPFKSS